MYVYPCKPQFYLIKLGCKGVFFTRTFYHDVCHVYRPEGATVANKTPLSSALLQPLPVNQAISQSLESNGDIPEPMRKYYFNVG